MDVLFPQVCGICGKLSGNSLCKKCEILLERQSKFEIYENDSLENYFHEHLYFFKYDGIIKQKIRQYKFKDKAYLYKLFAEIIYSNKKVMKYIRSYDYVIPIPLHKYRYRERGYNQAYLILKYLQKKDSKIKIKINILQKSKNIKPQSSLNKLERKDNIKNAYCIINSIEVKNKKILLFDDVFTTGSTTNECSRILKKSGAKKVGVLTIAKD